MEITAARLPGPRGVTTLPVLTALLDHSKDSNYCYCHYNYGEEEHQVVFLEVVTLEGI